MITLPAVTIYYSTLSGTNRQILTPKRYDEHPVILIGTSPRDIYIYFSPPLKTSTKSSKCTLSKSYVWRSIQFWRQFCSKLISLWNGKCKQKFLLFLASTTRLNILIDIILKPVGYFHLLFVSKEFSSSNSTFVSTDGAWSPDFKS